MLELHGLSLSNQAKGMVLLLIITCSAPAHESADYNSDGGNQVDRIAPYIIARENFAPHCTSASRPGAIDDLASPIAKTARMPAQEEEAGGQSLSFLGGKRDGDADLSLGLDFSVGTFAGGRARVAAA